MKGISYIRQIMSNPINYMKKAILILYALAACICANAQKINSYKASNGITYNIGDTIKLGRGSATNGDFLYLQMAGWGLLSYDASRGSDQFNINRGFAGMAVIVKKIKSYSANGQNKIYFIVDGGNISNYGLLIEDAIAFCEISDCKSEPQTKVDKYDNLKKLKELLDSGAITQEDYEKEKVKILK